MTFISVKYSNINFHGHPTSGIRRTDRHDSVNSRFSQFCERAQRRTVMNYMIKLLFFLIRMNNLVPMMYLYLLLRQ
jgi:hypothetical protein